MILTSPVAGSASGRSGAAQAVTGQLLEQWQRQVRAGIEQMRESGPR
jgi:hypothetical protein